MRNDITSARNGAVVAGTLLVALPVLDLIVGVTPAGPLHALIAAFGFLFLVAAALGGVAERQRRS